MNGVVFVHRPIGVYFILFCWQWKKEKNYKSFRIRNKNSFAIVLSMEAGKCDKKTHFVYVQYVKNSFLQFRNDEVVLDVWVWLSLLSKINKGKKKLNCIRNGKTFNEIEHRITFYSHVRVCPIYLPSSVKWFLRLYPMYCYTFGRVRKPVIFLFLFNLSL